MWRNNVLPLLLATALVGCDDSPATPDPEDPQEQLVATLREVTDPYHDFDAAVAAGFEQASPCVASPAGGMGFHYGLMSIVDAVVDASEPEILLYEPIGGDQLRLVGVEFLVPSEPWDAANAGPPEVAGQAFDDHRDESLWHGLPFPHYELHVWVWEENASGLFAPFNPAVSC